MRVSAQHKNARISAQKARLVADLIRGKDVAQALNILAFSPKKGAELIKKYWNQQSLMPSTTMVLTLTN